MPPPLSASGDHDEASRGARTDDVWYRDGLRFSCTSCGRCCSGARGYVWVEHSEIRAIASHLCLALDDVGRRYLRRAHGRYALLEKPASGDCVFLGEDRRCSIYSVRPRQCRSFPWWPAHLESPQAWSETAVECEGIGSQGDLVSSDRIRDALKRHRA